MKKTNILKSFSDLPSVTAQVGAAAWLRSPESSPPAGEPTREDFREMVRRRATTAAASVVPYPHWGLNE